MKKIIFSLVLFLLVVPALAEVTITTTIEQVEVLDPNTGDPIMVDTDTAIISWSTDPPELVRAFALDITLDKPADDADANATVDSVEVLDADYWVFPGSIDINEEGLVEDYGTPVGDPEQHADTKPGLDSNGVTIEVGSLYVGSPNAPATSGDLLKITVSDNCVLNVTPNAIRGGVVMEDGSSGTVWPGPKIWKWCYGTNLTKRVEWRKVGRPKCWCRCKNARQCKGDCDGIGQGKGANVYVSTYDTEVFRAAYGLTEAEMTKVKPCDKTVSDVDPGCTPAVANVRLICADRDHTGSGKAGDVRVSTNDTPVFRTPAADPLGNYGVANLPPNCP